MSLAQLASYGAASDEEDDDERHRLHTKKFPRLNQRSESRSMSPRSKSMPSAAAVSSSSKHEQISTPQNIPASSERSTRSMHADALSDVENAVHSDNANKHPSTPVVSGFPGRVIQQYGIEINVLPEPSHECDPDVERRILNLIKNRTPDENNENIKRRKDFRNPSIYEKLIHYCRIEEKGTNFPPSMFNMKQFGPDAYYDKLAELQNKFMEKQRDDEEKSKKRAVTSSISSSGALISSTTISTAIASSTSLAAHAKRPTATVSTATATTETASKDAKPKKSKWDR